MFYDVTIQNLTVGEIYTVENVSAEKYSNATIMLKAVKARMRYYGYIRKGDKTAVSITWHE